MMQIEYVHHAQVPYPRGAEAEARRFYGDVLELRELPRPAVLADRPGIWYDLGHSQQLHLLAMDQDIGSSSYHFALMLADLEATRVELRSRGVESEDRPSFEEYGYDRCVIHDPFGNLIELVQQRAAG
jgi:catechol 2,3-dioxygenase-like lactoylglutathione lyase family enzyme